MSGHPCALRGVLALLILTIAGSWADAAHAAFPGRNGKIAFYTNRDGNFEIYVMDPDGTNPTNLTNHPADDLSPAWSADGRRIAFSSNRGGTYDIYVMNADGSNVIQLTNGFGAGAPAWSPDGTRIAFTKAISDFSRQLYVMNANGTNLTNMTNDGAVSDDDPAWSPDGTKIAFSRSNPAGSTITDIWLMDVSGQNRQRITNNDGLLTSHPDWSPDGTKIALDIFTVATTYDVYVMPAAPDFDGSMRVRLTSDPGLDAYQRWSPDLGKIAFVSNRDGVYRIYVMNADGSNQTRVTHNVAAGYADFLGSWQPLRSASGAIAFVSNRDLNDEIYVMNTDGTGQTRLTNNPAKDYEPSFNPAGTKIAFTSQRDGHDQIYVMSADGSGQIRLTDSLAPTRDYGASFSGDGGKIAFVSDRDGKHEIYVMNADGSGVTRLTDTAAPDKRNYEPSFSDDGTKIAFTSQRDSTDSNNDEIYVMNADGSGQTRLTFGLANDLTPSYSPDGTKIAFASTRDANGNIYLIDLTVANPTDPFNQPRLTESPWRDLRPSFSRDGSKIAFASNRDSASGQEGPDEIYVMNADGSGQTRLTYNLAARDYAPSFGGGGARYFLAGTNVVVAPSDQTGATVTLTFSNVTQGGYATVTRSATGPAVPAGFALGNPPIYYDITTTAGYSGDVHVCIAYDDAAIGDESQLKLAHFDGSGWFDVTSPPVDTQANVICGTVASLSPFAIFKPATFQFSGFFPPVDNPGPAPSVYNKVKAGLSIPVKFSLGGNQGLNILAADFPKSSAVSCGAVAAVDAIEETVTATKSGLTYDAATDRYTYVWKTEKSWASTCRKLTLRLTDGTDHVAYFSFTK